MTMGDLPEVVSPEEWLDARRELLGRGIEEFHDGYPWLDLTALGRQEEWEEPKGRAAPLGLQVGGPAMRLPDEVDT
jgi:predicted dithiol-disulfide oxidoreductase (DUF899 family)